MSPDPVPIDRREAKLRLGPLSPGRYAVLDDFNQQARGMLVVTGD